MSREVGHWADSLPTGWTHCRDCHVSFPGTQVWGHCAACHRTFRGLGAFDAHQFTNNVEKRSLCAPSHLEKYRGRGHWYTIRHHVKGDFDYFTDERSK